MCEGKVNDRFSIVSMDSGGEYGSTIPLRGRSAFHGSMNIKRLICLCEWGRYYYQLDLNSPLKERVLVEKGVYHTSRVDRWSPVTVIHCSVI